MDKNDILPSELVYKRYLSISSKHNSKPAYFSDCFSKEEVPSDGLVDFREARGQIFCGENVSIKKLTTMGKGRVVVVLGSNSVVHNVLVNNLGEDLFLFFGPDSELKNLVIQAFDKNNYLHFGCGTTDDGGNFLLQGDDSGIFIGHDCMFSTHIHIRTSDSHSIFDYTDGNRINHDQSVHIGDHVWIGRQVIVGKGVFIADDTIVGQGSVVSGQLDSHAIYAGVPARKIKDNVTWERPRVSSLVDISATMSWRPRQRRVNAFLKEDQPFSTAVNHVFTEERQSAIPAKTYRWLCPNSDI